LEKQGLNYFFYYGEEMKSEKRFFLFIVSRQSSEHRHRIDQIPKPIAVENINTRHLVGKFLINSRIFLFFPHRIDQILY